MKNPPRAKLYYTISEVADLTDLQPHTLRAWEKEYSCLRPKRSRGKNRAYRERDIAIVLLIRHLLYDERYTSQGVKQRLKNEPGLVRDAAGDLATMLDPSARKMMLHGHEPLLDTADSPGEGTPRETTASSCATSQQLRETLQAARRELRALLELI